MKEIITTEQHLALNDQVREFVLKVIEVRQQKNFTSPLQKSRAEFTIGELGKENFYFRKVKVVAEIVDDEIKHLAITPLDGLDFEETMASFKAVIEFMTKSMVDEPEVLIIGSDAEGQKTYKISKNWLTWFKEYIEHNSQRDSEIGVARYAAQHAINLHFTNESKEGVVTFEFPFLHNPEEVEGGIPVNFYLATRRKL